MLVLRKPWAEQPQEHRGVNRSSLIGGVLDRLWIGNQLDGRCIISGLSAPPPSGSTLTPMSQGLAVSAGGTTTNTAIGAITSFPIVLFGFGYFNTSAGAWELSGLSASGGGYLARIALASETTVALDLQIGFGTLRSTAITLSSSTGVMICAAAQIFSDTDYRVYINGQMASGTLTAGTMGGGFNQTLNAASHLNGGMLASGYGVGRSVPDDYMMALTRNHSAVWSELIAPQQIMIPMQAAVTAYWPGSDITVTGWTGNPDNANKYANLDETVGSDTDYCESPDLTTSATFGWQTALPAGTWDVKFRGIKTGTNGQIRIVVKDSGGTALATGAWHAQTGSYAEYTDTLTTSASSDRFTIEVQT